MCVCVFLKYLLYLNCVLAGFVLFAFRTVLWVGLRSVIVAIPWSFTLAFWIVEPEKFFNHKTGKKVFIMTNCFHTGVKITRHRTCFLAIYSSFREKFRCPKLNTCEGIS